MRPFIASVISRAILAIVLTTVINASTPSTRLLDQFDEPLIKTAPTSDKEDRALLAAIAQYRSDSTDVQPLATFMHDWPNSGWRLAVLTNMGLTYYHSGYFSRAIESWEAAWKAGKDLTDQKAMALTDRAVGELARMHARLGHADRLQSLLAEIGERPVTGPATEAIAGAREGLWMMRNEPGVAYLCGPMALKNLLLSQGRAISDVAFLDDVRSGPNGTSLQQVAHLAEQAKFSYELIFRAKGQPVPVPSIVHWKVSHFAAIVGQAHGKFHLQDPTFGEELWVSEAALDAEASGYFLKPRGVTNFADWRRVNSAEVQQVHGMGYTATSDPTATRPQDIKVKNTQCSLCPPCGRGMCDYNVQEMLVSLNLNDTPVGYAPPVGPPAYVTLTYNQREAFQPANFSYFNVSQKWTLNWLSYIQDDPVTPGANVARYVAGGGLVYYPYDPNSGTFQPETTDASTLVQVSSSPVVYQRNLPDGSQETYSQSNGALTYPRRIFLTKIQDPGGNAVTLNYDSSVRLTSLTDATGRSTKFFYDLTATPLLITRITDPFGRTATLTYDSIGRLSSITDVLGLVSQFSYDSSNLIDSMKTPYGVTQFAYGQAGNYRWLNVTDPLGYTERVEFRNFAPGIPASDPSSTVPPGIVNAHNNYMNGRNTFYWDKHVYPLAVANRPVPDYTQARIRHWAHLRTNPTATSHTLESVKAPLENRLWYAYPGQPISYYSGTLDSATKIARVLDDGSQQLIQVSYNQLGYPTELIDAVGRDIRFEYDTNGVDLLTIQQKTSSVGFSTTASYTYNGQHRPLTYTDPSGQTTTYTYNAAGQKTSETDALGNLTRYEYDANGDLITVVNANNKTAWSLTYDSFDRIATATDSEGHKISYEYDAFDRITKSTYPDGTTDQYSWKNLDLASITDREGRITQFDRDAVRNLVSVTDPLSRKTKYGYYENQLLKSLTDANDSTTSWNIDIEGRITGKQYADGRSFVNTYEATTSRIKAITDPLGQTKQLGYAADDTVTSITYLDAVNPTPNVAFSYDPYFSRMTSMTDGSGVTHYSYVPPGSLGALQVATEVGPFANSTISYQYDALGRLSARTIDSSTETFSYDKLQREVTHTSPLGAFTYAYLGQTGQPTSVAAGMVGTSWVYDTNSNDRRLKQILNGSRARSYSLTTTPEDQITQIVQTGATTQTWNYKLDNSDRLLQAQTSSANYQYRYDPADNVTSQDTPLGTNNATYNAVNEIETSHSSSFTYDANGNVTADSTRTYAWDAENRLIRVSFKGQPARNTSFRYDGMSRRIAIVAASGVSSVETHYLWCDDFLCQQRTVTDGVSRRYYPEGEFVAGTNTALYYSQDQVGSVRDVLSAQSGAALASFDYDPYGNITQASGAASTDFRFAGLFLEQNSGLYLAEYRAYDAVESRWLNRDPIGEEGGLNLYGYVADSPTLETDPMGTATPDDIKAAWDALLVAQTAFRNGLISQAALAQAEQNLRLLIGLAPGIKITSSIVKLAYRQALARCSVPVVVRVAQASGPYVAPAVAGGVIGGGAGKFVQRRTGSRVAGGTTAVVVGGAVGYIAAGAVIGSIAPGVGTVVGAGIGAAAAVLVWAFW